MRWSIIRLIWVRELRDQLRDRRTILMIVFLPLVLYPALGMGVMQMAAGIGGQDNVVGVYNAEALADPGNSRMTRSPLPLLGWLAAMPAPGTSHAWLNGAILAELDDAALHYPPLLELQSDGSRFLPRYTKGEDTGNLRIVRLGELSRDDLNRSFQNGKLADDAPVLEPLKNHKVNVVLVVEPNFRRRLERGEQPEVAILALEGDDHSRQATSRVRGILDTWRKQLKETRMLRRGLPADYDEVIRLQDPERNKPTLERAADNLVEMMGRIFPFLLVMWSLAGALYPAVDLCAGEKERGTMETLLISPVSREEIVYGKFLAIWVFSAATALLNLVSMAITAWNFLSMLPKAVLKPEALLWCVLLIIPLSAFFSALCLALGAYARSSKEGQYYLMPLFLLTMPLVFLTLMPGVELNPFYSLVPVTGVALLLRSLITVSIDRTTGIYFLPVLAPMMLYGWLALRWAVMQFQREEVLFREAERLDLGLWLRRVFREKEALPSVGQGLFCMGLILVLRWLSFGFGASLPLMASTGIAYLAFVLAPPVFMAALLTTRPVDALGLRMPSGRALLLGFLLGLVLLIPMAELVEWVLSQFPHMHELLREGNPLTRELEGVAGHPHDVSYWVQYLAVFGLLAPVAEELAFRGFLLGALLRRFRPWVAILLSSFLFALYHGNVFQFAPSFVAGVVLALLAARTGSVWPGMLLHAVHNSLLFFGVLWLEGVGGEEFGLPNEPVLGMVLAALSTLAAGVLVWRLAVSKGRLRRAEKMPIEALADGEHPNGQAAEGKPTAVKPENY